MKSAQKIPGRHSYHVFGAVFQFEDGGGFESAVHHAILAGAILAGFPILPVDGVPEILPGGKEFFAQKITRGLPTFGSKGDGAPWRAFVVAHPGGEFEIHGSRAEPILF